MGGGGGDGGYAAQQAALESQKQSARDALNAMFGIGSATPSASMQAPGAGSVSPVSGGGTASFPGGYTNPASYPYPDIYDPAAGQTSLQMPDLSGSSAAPADTSAADNKAGLDDLYSKVRNDAFTAGQQRLDDNKTTAARKLRFTLMAQGLNGGSADIDENALLDRTYKQGLLDLGTKADQAANDMRSNDEQTRLGLLQSIDSGMDQGSALSSALNQMKINSDRAATAAQGTDLGDLFANAGLLYSTSNAAQGSAAARAQFPYLYGMPGYPSPNSGGAAGPMISNNYSGRP